MQEEEEVRRLSLPDYRSNQNAILVRSQLEEAEEYNDQHTNSTWIESYNTPKECNTNFSSNRVLDYNHTENPKEKKTTSHPRYNHYSGPVDLDERLI